MIPAVKAFSLTVVLITAAIVLESITGLESEGTLIAMLVYMAILAGVEKEDERNAERIERCTTDDSITFTGEKP